GALDPEHRDARGPAVRVNESGLARAQGSFVKRVFEVAPAMLPEAQQGFLGSAEGAVVEDGLEGELVEVLGAGSQDNRGVPLQMGELPVHPAAGLEEIGLDDVAHDGTPAGPRLGPLKPG